MVRSLRSKPGASVTSEVPLHLDGPGIEEPVLDAPRDADAAQVRCRYEGLRVLAYAGGKLFLVHEGWPWEDPTIPVLDEDDPAIRIAFIRHLDN